MPLDFSSMGTPVGVAQGDGVSDASQHKPDFASFGTPVPQSAAQPTVPQNQPVIAVSGADDMWGTITQAAETPTQPSSDGKTPVGVAESFGRGWGQAGAESGKAASLAFVAPAVVYDKVKNLLTGSTDTSLSDSAFKRFVDPMQAASDWYALKPDEKQTFLAKFAQGVGGLIQDLPAMIASGGASAEAEIARAVPGVGQHLVNVVSKGFDAMRPLMLKSATEKAQQVLDAGGTPEQAVNSGTTAALLTGFMGSAPMASAGKAVERLLTGLPIGVMTGEFNRRVQNAADPDNLQVPFTAEGAAINAVTNAAMAGAMGHPEAPRPVTRDTLGYAPTGAVATLDGTSRAGAVADMADAAVGATAKLTPTDVLTAPTVDDAIAKATAAVTGPVTDSTGQGVIARQMDDGVASNAVRAQEVARQQEAQQVEAQAQDHADAMGELTTAKEADIAKQVADNPIQPQPTAMQLAMQRAQDRVTEKSPVTESPDVSNTDANGAVVAEPGAGERTESVRGNVDEQRIPDDAARLATPAAAEPAPSSQENLAVRTNAEQTASGTAERAVVTKTTSVEPAKPVTAEKAVAAPIGKIVSTFTGKFGKGMGRDAATLEAKRLNRDGAAPGVTYASEEHGKPLENPYAVVGRETPKTENSTATETETSQPQGDTGADIPPRLFKKVKVDHQVWIEDEQKHETVKVTAKQALKSIDDDISGYKALLDCMKG